MSRIGKKLIAIPAGVAVSVSGNTIVVKGPKGELARRYDPAVAVRVENGSVGVSLAEHRAKMSARWGLWRSLIANMITGVTSGFEKKLEIEGIGYRATREGDTLILQLGFSHPVRFPVPERIAIGVEKNVITVSGIDKQEVGDTAARIRALKKPEPYKGKGIRYQGEVIRRKVGKKAVASA